MKNKLLLLFLLLSLTLGACQREAYPPTATPGATEATVNTPLSASMVTPGPAGDEPGAADSRPDWETLYTEANPVPYTILTSDGVELQGTFYPAENMDAPLIVLMHWALGDQDDWKAIAPWLQNRGVQPEVANGASWLNPEWFPPMPEGVSFNVFTFSFRGCEGMCQSRNPEGWLLDIQAVMSTIRGLENVDLSRVATIGASIGADGAAVGCDTFNAQSPGCLGALSLSPGGYLKDPYPDEVAKLEAGSPPVPTWCLYAAGDTPAADACQNAAGDLYQVTAYDGDAHAMLLLSPEFEPNPLTRVLEFLNEIGMCEACP